MRRWLGCIGGSILTLLLAQHGAAQSVAVRQSASVDLAALVSGEVRVSIEPAVFGRSVVGVSLARWSSSGGPAPLATPATSLVVPVGIDQFDHPAREYMLDLYVRVYPATLSSGGPGHRVSGYVGGFLGFDRREGPSTYSACPVGYACPLTGSSGSAITCLCPLIASPGSGGVACPCPPPTPTPSTSAIMSFAVEPGAELGVRAMPTASLMLELGAWARLITAPDPTGRFVEGQIDPRLIFAVGVRW